MRLTPTLRAIALAVLVFLATAAVWWLVGFQIGKGVLEEAGGGAVWRGAFGFRDGGTARLLFLAVLAVLAGAVAAAAQGASRWPILAALALGAALVLGAHQGGLAATVLFVLAAGATSEADAGAAEVVAAAVLGLVVAFAEALDVSFTAGQGAIAVLLRGLLFWLPLLLGPSLAERYVLGRAVRAR